MSSEHQSDSEDADESQQDRPNSGAVPDKEDDPGIAESEDEDDIPRAVCTPPPGSSEDPQVEERKPPCQTAAAPPAGSAGGSGSGSGRRNSLFSWLQRRAIRRGVFVDPARDNFRTMTSLYSSMSPAVDSVNLSTQTHGAVFNLEYSPDG